MIRAVLGCTAFALIDIAVAYAFSRVFDVDFTFCLALMVCGTANTALYVARK